MNQGATYTKERDGGFLWAPMLNKVSTGAVSRLGAKIGNHAMTGTVAVKAQPLMAGRPAQVPLGNAVATNVGKGGPGTGRTVYVSGSQGRHGKEGE